MTQDEGLQNLIEDIAIELKISKTEASDFYEWTEEHNLAVYDDYKEHWIEISNPAKFYTLKQIYIQYKSNQGEYA